MKTSFARAELGFAILFALYQSAEGIGGRLVGSFAVQAGLMIACLAAAWPVGRYVLRFRGFDAYALEWRPRVPLWLVGGVLLSFAAKLAAVAIGSRVGVYSVGPPAAAEAALLPVIALAIVSTFVPSITEDILTRGFWWRVPGTAMRGATFIAVSSLIYVLNHIYRVAGGPSEWLMLFCFGIAYAAALVRTGSLWAAVGVHWGWNLANALLGQFADVQTLGDGGWMLSAAAHLLMAAIILAMPSRKGA